MSALYAHGKEALSGGLFSWADPVKAVLIDLGGYSPNFVGDIFLSDIPAPARVAESPTLTGKTNFAGVFDADDVTFPLVTGPDCEALVLLWDTGSPATDRLLAYIDEAVGLPVIPNGHDTTVYWDNGPKRIFRIV